jgi:hypothetical protein
LSRELNDDFDENDLPSGSLDLEKGSGQVGAGAPSTYGTDGIDFDDDLYGNDDAGANKALELDLPNAPPGAAPPPGSPMDVPDLAFDAAPQRGRSGHHPAPAAPPPRSSGSLQAVRTSGTHPGTGQSGHHPAAGGIPSAPPSSSRGVSGGQASPPPGEEGHHGFAPPAPSSASGLDDPSGPHSAPTAAMPPMGPPKPTAAAVIAKYPAPPTKITQAPIYTVRVILRQLELRTDLESLRRRRSPDVPLYEAALRAYDTKTFRLGMAINCAVLAIATFIFFLPVMIRFIRAD